MAGKGILLDETGDLLIKNKSLLLGKTHLQEVALILGMVQGEHKFQPLLGCNLIKKIKTNQSRFKFENTVKIQLALDNKDFDSIKHLITLILK